jgi:hypothetical protein
VGNVDCDSPWSNPFWALDAKHNCSWQQKCTSYQRILLYGLRQHSRAAALLLHTSMRVYMKD